MTANERHQMYQQFPAALVEELVALFGVVRSDQERVEHNLVVVHLDGLFPTDESKRVLLQSVARTILSVAQPT